MKELNILGVSIKEYSLKESLALTDIYLKNGAMNTVLFVSAKMLLAAGENPELKEWIETMDMTVCAEPDILRAADMATMSRMREIENNAYLKEIVRRLFKAKKSVYLLTEKEEDIAKLKEQLRQVGPALKIAAENNLEAVDENIDKLVNHMNDVAADVIISMIPFPKQEMIIAQNKNFINAEVWFALLMPEESYKGKGNTNFWSRFIQSLHFSKFKKKVENYKETE